MNQTKKSPVFLVLLLSAVSLIASLSGIRATRADEAAAPPPAPVSPAPVPGAPPSDYFPPPPSGTPPPPPPGFGPPATPPPFPPQGAGAPPPPPNLPPPASVPPNGGAPVTAASPPNSLPPGSPPPDGPPPGSGPVAIPQYYPGMEPQPYSPRRRRRWGGGDSLGDATYQLAVFRIAEIEVMQGAVHQFAPYFSWNPSLVFKSGSYVGLMLGGTSLTDATNSNFLAIDFDITFGTRLGNSPIGIEGGVGFQDWGSSGGANPALLVNLFYAFPDFLIERVFVGCEGVFLSDYFTTEVKAGFAISF